MTTSTGDLLFKELFYGIEKDADDDEEERRKKKMEGGMGYLRWRGGASGQGNEGIKEVLSTECCCCDGKLGDLGQMLNSERVMK